MDILSHTRNLLKPRAILAFSTGKYMNCCFVLWWTAVLIGGISWTWNVLSTWNTWLLEYNYHERQISCQPLMLGVVAKGWVPLLWNNAFYSEKKLFTLIHLVIGLWWFTRRQWIKQWRMHLHSQEVFLPRQKGSLYSALLFYLWS